MTPQPAPGPRSAPRHYRAPWSPLLRGVTVLVLAILASVTIATWLNPAQSLGTRILVTALAMGMTAACLANAIWGYEVAPGEIRVLRSGWVTRLDLSTLEAVAFEPKAARGAWRIMGTGGFFVFAGLYWSRRQGWMRFLATDFTRSVILRFRDRKVILTPDPPIEFVEHVGRLLWPRSKDSRHPTP